MSITVMHMQLPPRAPGPLPPPNSDINAIEYVGTLRGIRYVMYSQQLSWAQSKAYCEANGQVGTGYLSCRSIISHVWADMHSM